MLVIDAMWGYRGRGGSDAETEFSHASPIAASGCASLCDEVSGKRVGMTRREFGGSAWVWECSVGLARHRLW